MAIDRDGEGPPLRRDDARRDNPRDGDDLRATPFTDEVFGDERRSRGGRSWSLVIGVVLGVALIGGVGWYAFKGNGGGLAPGEVQAVKADPLPYKVKPDNPGGMQVDNQDKLVYDRVAKGSAPNRVENLLPPPEEPKAPPVKPQTETKPAVAPAASPAVAPAVAQNPPAAKPATDDKQAMIKPADEPAKASAPPPAAPAKTLAPDPLAAAVAAATGGKTEAALTPADTAPTKTVPTQTAPTQTAMATPAPAAASAAPGAFQIQLASVSSEDAANAEWKRISGRHKDLFAALSPAVSKADLGDRGIYYRLRAGPLADKAAADDLCSALAADKIGCIVVKP